MNPADTSQEISPQSIRLRRSERAGVEVAFVHRERDLESVIVKLKPMDEVLKIALELIEVAKSLRGGIYRIRALGDQSEITIEGTAAGMQILEHQKVRQSPGLRVENGSFISFVVVGRGFINGEERFQG